MKERTTKEGGVFAIEDFARNFGREQLALNGKAYSQIYRNEKLIKGVLYGYWKFADMQPIYWRSVLRVLEETQGLQNPEALANFLTRLGDRTSWFTRHTGMHSGEVQQAINLSYRVSGMMPLPVKIITTDFSTADRTTRELISNGELVMPEKLGGTGAHLAHALAKRKIKEVLGCQTGNISSLIEINARIVGNVASKIEKPPKPYIVTLEGVTIPREPEPDNLQLIDVLDRGYAIAGEVHKNSDGRTNGSEVVEFLVFDLRPKR